MNILTAQADLRRLHTSVQRAVFEAGPKDGHTETSAKIRIGSVRQILVDALESMAVDYSKEPADQITPKIADLRALLARALAGEEIHPTTYQTALWSAVALLTGEVSR